LRPTLGGSMLRRYGFSMILGAAVIAAASATGPLPASALSRATSAQLCPVQPERFNATTVRAWGVRCDWVQARIERYYGGKIYTYYGNISSWGASLASSTNGTFSGGVGRGEVAGRWGSWVNL
ncbi:MAG: hypothetical protein ACRC0L_02995, partial [Angustibacter sp.]